MKADVAKFVSQCLNCQKVKAKRQRPAGLLQPLPEPAWKWDCITMDFVMGLPLTPRVVDAVWVIVDRLTKTSRFIPIGPQYTLESLAKFYQATIKMSPYEALYGRKCRTPLFWNEVGECSIVGPEFVEETYRVVVIIKERVKTAQNRQKQYADTRRRDLEFAVGDKVFLKKYVKDPTHLLIVDLLELTDDLTFEVTPTEINSQKVQRLRNRDIYYVKVTWKSRDMEEITWEVENAMRKQYPHLIQKVRTISRTKFL
ncbi:hypothetical protein NE237_023952 [Protea cynaroides]|uniref:Polyprotein n=1 Tax=Protea cynaroides TaxID=273540 RepID=A0A9Q0HFW3_9MAGN|nr:hypothetical protein NE237_023952 [Protea cynaroides]